MKKIMLLLIVMMSSGAISLYSQTIIKTYKNVYGTWNRYKNKYDLQTTREAKINFSVYETYISASDESNSIYRPLKKTNDGPTEDGRMLTYECLDERNRVCHFTYMNYDNPDRSDTIMIIYDAFVYVYFISEVIVDED